jgi:hypothetical protein
MSIQEEKIIKKQVVKKATKKAVKPVVKKVVRRVAKKATKKVVKKPASKEVSTELDISMGQAQAMKAFSTPMGVQPFIEKIKAHASPQVYDMSIRKDREALRTLASNITQSNTFLTKTGKTQADIAKAMPNVIDAERRRVKAEVLNYRDEIRQPLTDWEDAEADRKADIKDRIRAFASDGLDDFGTERLGSELEKLNSIEIDESFDEFAELARAKLDRCIVQVTGLITISQAADVEANRLELERAALAAENQRIREQQIADDARKKAERIAKDQKQRAEDDAERERLQLQLANEKQSKALMASEQARKDAEAKASQDVADAEAKAMQDVADAEFKAQQDNLAEIARLDAEAAKRESDVVHNAKINNAALDALISAGVDPMEAKKAVIAIAQKKIPAVTISY